MKLELKHLAPYLPYNLKTDKGRLSLLEGDYCECKKAMLSTRYICESIKPILRPLSDLTKEIEVYGEKFLPVNEILRTFNQSLNHLSTEYQIKALQKFNEEVTSQNLPYRYIQKLFEWHFDVFGLIEKGLAIDINEITPSKNYGTTYHKDGTVTLPEGYEGVDG